MTQKSRTEWVTYERCFVLTLGLISLALIGYILIFETADVANWPIQAWLLLGVMVSAGLGALLVGLRGSAHRVRNLARAGSRHEASLFIVVVAAPLYFILNLGRSRR